MKKLNYLPIFIFILLSVFYNQKDIYAEEKDKVKDLIWDIEKKELNNKIKNNQIDSIITLSSKYVKQGEFIYIDVKSSKDILDCIGFLGERKINFYRRNELNHFRGFLAFEIDHVLGEQEILITVFFRKKIVKTFKEKIKILRKIVKYIPISKYIKKKILKSYKYKGKIIKKWVTVRKKVRRYINPPILTDSGKNLRDDDVNQKIRDQISNINDIQQSIIDLGIGEEAYDDKNEDHRNIVNINFSKNDNSLFLQKIQDLEFDNIQKIIEAQKNTDEKSILEEEILRNVKIKNIYKIWDPIDYTQGPFIFPLKVQEGRKRVSSDFGVYRRFRYKGRLIQRYHRGLDIAAKKGTPIYATNSAKVVLSGHFGHAGIVVILSHGLGIYSCYFHLSETQVKENYFVNKGQLIGYVGNTGISTGPHLHWQIMINDISTNILNFRNYSLKEFSLIKNTK